MRPILRTMQKIRQRNWLLTLERWLVEMARWQQTYAVRHPCLHARSHLWHLSVERWYCRRSTASMASVYSLRTQRTRTHIVFCLIVFFFDEDSITHNTTKRTIAINNSNSETHFGLILMSLCRVDACWGDVVWRIEATQTIVMVVVLVVVLMNR